jgi:CHASE3 domain sensor protein
MTLLELSADYRAAAEPLRRRLKLLRQLVAQCDDPEELWHLKRRIAELTPMLTQMNELADLTQHYYERGYYRSEKYTL